MFAVVLAATRAGRSRRRSSIRYFGIDGTFGFGAWFGFASLRRADRASPRRWACMLKRPDTYYDELASPSRPACVLILGGLILPLLQGQAARRPCSWRCR